MDINAGWTELSNAIKVFRAQWDHVKDDWRDQVQEDFEARYVQPLEAQVGAVLSAMDRLGPQLMKARTECS